jgi:DNA-directed RNA polymerase II subunit RPB1
MSLVHSIKTGTDEVKSVKRIQFGILSPESILSQSVADIHKHMTKGGELQGTLMDPRLGATRTTRNSITGLDSKMDPGIFGHHVLAMPVYHPIFFSTVHNVLRAFCPACSALRETEHTTADKIRYKVKVQRRPRSKRLAFVLDLLSKKKAQVCKFCGTDLPDIAVDKGQILGFAFAYPDPNIKGKKEKFPKNAKTIHNILKKISDSDSDLIGLNPKTSRPEWMLFTILPVSPPTMRPSVIADNNKTSDDDITQSIHNIIKWSNILTACLEEHDGDLENTDVVSAWQTLQAQTAALVDNETNAYAKVCNRAQRGLKTLKGRHKGKTGRIRNNLCGKRTNYSSRTVITADPNLSSDEVGVPLEMAMILTYPEIVNANNINELTTLVRRGPNVYPGAREIKKPGQSFTLDLDCIKDRGTLILSYGTTVYRHLINGDIVLFNRQPSLHKMNMMAHYVRVLPGRSFRMSANITQPYGADFDGDEMNLHVPQSEMARREIERLALTPTQMCSPQYNAPVVGAVQDTMLATYRASSEQTRGYTVNETYRVNVREFMNLSFWITKTPDMLPDIVSDNGWTMQELLNLILPPITVSRKSKQDPTKMLIIENGVLKAPAENEGVIVPMAKSNSLLGASSGSLFHIAWNDLGPNAAKDLMDDLSRVMTQWLMISGFSVGLRDLEIPQVYMDEIDYDKEEYLEKAHILMEGLHSGTYTDEFRKSLGLSQRGLTTNNYEQFEQDMMFILDSCRNRVQEYVVSHIEEYEVGKKYDNRFMSMVSSGSKGKPTNAVQIVGILGQQILGGSRVMNFIRRRPLPFVPKDDLSPAARGFVRSSYNSGLNFLEYIYHAMAGRMGVISTSIKTAETGYLQRKLMKRLEDIGSYYDGTVRLAAGAIVQYIYGGDGYDGSKIEKQVISHMAYSVDELLLRYRFSEVDWEGYELYLSDVNGDDGTGAGTDTGVDMNKEREYVEREVTILMEDWKYLRDRYPYNLPENVPSVVNFDRLINGTLTRMGASGTLPYMSKEDVLTPSYVIERVDKLVQEDLHLPTNAHINKHCMRQFVALLRSKLSSKFLIMQKCYNRSAFDELVEEIQYKFYNGLITPGEAVGALAAQCIGEPGTQMTLDAFHSAGAKITVSGGVPRFKEILSLTKMKTPSVSIYLEGIELPVEISQASNGAKTISEVDTFLLNLAETDREQAKTLKKEFVKLYLNNPGKSVLSVKGGFEYVKFGDLVKRSEVHYIHSAEYDPDRAALQENDIKSADDATQVEYPLWLVRFTLDHNGVVNVLEDLQALTDTKFGHEPSMQLTYLEGEAGTDHIMRGVIGMNAGNMSLMNQRESALMGTKIRGISSITKTRLRTERKDIYLDGPYGKIVRRGDLEHSKLSEVMMGADNYIIDTVGSNLTDILGMDNVDPYRTYTNDINEMQKTYGIEMGRKSIIRETQEVLANAGAAIDVRHIGLLADAMTCRGFMQKIDRYGAKKGESGPLSLASFEETTTIMCDAAIHGEEETMLGVSSNIMFGQFINLGTNAFDLYLDETMILEYAEPPAPEPQLPTVLDTADIEACGEEGMRFDFML